MSVALGTFSESHTGVAGNTTAGTFSWNHATTGARGLAVLVNATASSALPPVTGITADGTANLTNIGLNAVSAVSGGENGTISCWYLDDVPQSASCPIAVVRTGTVSVYAAALSITADAAATATEAYGGTTTGTTTTTVAPSTFLPNVDDGSPGSDSLRVCAGYYGQNSVAALDSSTLSNTGMSIDYGSYTFEPAYEATPGQGARPIGFASSATTADDWAAVAFAIRERIPAPAGTIPDVVMKSAMIESRHRG